MGKKQFTQDQKLSVLKGASTVGIKEAARLAEVHCSTVYDWKHQVDALGEEGLGTWGDKFLFDRTMIG